MVVPNVIPNKLLALFMMEHIETDSVDICQLQIVRELMVLVTAECNYLRVGKTESPQRS